MKSNNKLKTKAFLYWDSEYTYVTFAVCLPGTTRVVYTQELTAEESEQYTSELPDINALAFSDMVWHNDSMYQTTVRRVFSTTYNNELIPAEDFVTSALELELDLGEILNIDMVDKDRPSIVG